MSELLTLIQEAYARFDFEPIDTFSAKVSNITSYEEITGVRGALHDVQYDLELNAIVTNSISVTTTAVIDVNWFANYNGNDCLSIDFYGAGGGWRSTWEINKVLDFVRTLEKGLSTGELPNSVSLNDNTNEITVSGLNTATPELYLSGIYEARVTSIDDIASFLIGFAIDARGVLAGARDDVIYNETGYR